ncbi:MAG: AlpA family phage regulatory protein [Alphaproteobacteria bacterium]|nr:AlpA family phage regulatory protein [Alphaproteobacteria bacterium]
MLQILRKPEVKRLTGLSNSSIYLKISQGTFPAPFPLGENARAVGWEAESIQNWIKKQIEASRLKNGDRHEG